MSVKHVASLPSTPHAHQCPWWLGWALACPIRKLFERPDELLGSMVTAGSRVLEVGPGMGFFTGFMAERVGAEGCVHCVDVQEQMLKGLRRRLKRRGLEGRVTLRHCEPTSLGIGDLAGTIDVAVLIYMLHEVPDPRTTLAEVAMALCPTGRLLLVEPKGHVSPEVFEAQLVTARECGLVPVEQPAGVLGRRRRVALLARA